MRTTKKQVQTILSKSFPFNMTYQRAQPVRVGKGKWRKRIPRVLGATDDRLFSVFIYGSSMSVRKVEFMNPFNDKAVLARNMVAIRAVITALCPDWDEDSDNWLATNAARIPDNVKVKHGQVELSRLDVYGQGILFVTIQ